MSALILAALLFVSVGLAVLAAMHAGETAELEQVE